MPRLRMIAGPNGSGKTTLTNAIRAALGEKFGLHTNADELEASLRQTGQLNLSNLGIHISENKLRQFVSGHPLAGKADVSFSFRNGTLSLTEPLSRITYFPAVLAEAIREQLVQSNASFVFETVMSEPGKIDLLHRAQALGYRTYLYFVCVEDPLINTLRVADRVQKGGHNVPEEKIRQRYDRSLSYLLDAVKASNRAYLFDNSGTGHRLISEITDGRYVRFDTDFVPTWFINHFLNRIG